MSAHLDTGKQLGGFNLETNTNPEFDTSVYNIFDKTNPASEKEEQYTEWLLPERKIQEDTNVITYTMIKQDNKFTDFAGIRMWGTTKLEKRAKNSTDAWVDVTETDNVSVVNNAFQAQFARIVLTINDTEITDPGNDPYPYTSYMATLFNTTPEYKKHLADELYVKDTPKTLGHVSGQVHDKYVWTIDPEAIDLVSIMQPVYEKKSDGSGEDDITKPQEGKATVSSVYVLTSKKVKVKRELQEKYNEGFVKRRKTLLKQNNEQHSPGIPIMRRLDHDIVTALSVAPPRTKIGFKFYKQNQEFLILKDGVKHSGDEFRMRLVNMKLEIPLSKVKAKVGVPYMRMLKNPSHVPTINFTRNFTKMYNVLNDSSMEFHRDNWIAGGQIPDTMILSFVRQAAFIGDDTMNPFNFELIEFNNINLIIDGEQEYPLPFNSNTEAGKRQLYHKMQDSCGRNQQTGYCLDITYEEFLNGYFFLYFDLTPAKDNRATKTEKRSGNLSIVLNTDGNSQHNKESFLDKNHTNWKVLVHSVFPANIKFYGDTVVVPQFVG